MKSKLLAALLGCACLSAVTMANANELAIYKFASTRVWTQYPCHRPDSTDTAAPPIPKNTLAGTYAETEYWILDRTTNLLQVVIYYSFVDHGATIKEYIIGQPQSVDPSVTDPDAASLRGIQTIKSNVANTFNVCLATGGTYQDSTTDSDGDGNPDFFTGTEEGNFIGLGKPYTVAPGKIFAALATSLAGQYTYSSRSEFIDAGAVVKFRRVYYENATTSTVTLDAVLTKNANVGIATPVIPYGGGTALTAGTPEYGLRLVTLALDTLGYDNNASPVPPAN